MPDEQKSFNPLFNPFVISQMYTSMVNPWLALTHSAAESYTRNAIPMMKSGRDYLGLFPTNQLMMPLIEQYINNLELTANFVSEVTRRTNVPVIDVPHKTIWENDLVKLEQVITDYESDKLFHINIPVMRGPFLAFYKEPGNQNIKSYGHAILSKRSGQITFTDWKNPDSKTKNATIEDYLDTFHDISFFLRENVGQPNNIDLCQPGYFDILNLAKNPEDALTLTLVATPHNFIDKASILYDAIRSINEEMIDMLIQASGGVCPGKFIADSWGIATPELIKKNYVDKYYEMAVELNECRYNRDRAHIFDDWMFADIRDIPGPTYKFICLKLAKDNLLLNDSPMGYSQKNFKRPVTVVIGSEDDIVVEKMAVTAFDYLGSADKRLFKVKGGHAAVFNGSAAIEETRRSIIPHILEQDRKMKRIDIYHDNKLP